MPNNPPKNDAPDKALVERLRDVNGWLSTHYDDEAEEHGCAIDDAIVALSQPQHGGLVEAALREAIEWDGHDSEGIPAVWLDQALVALASNSPVVGEDAPAIQCAACEDHPKAPNNPCAVCGKGKPTPTDTADRREAVRGKVKGIINAHVAECLRLQSPLHPGPTADAILSLIAGPPEGFVMVPVEPTEAMLCAWATSDKVKDDWRADCRAGWSAMIAAATGEAS